MRRFLKADRWWDSQVAVMMVLVYQPVSLARPAPFVLPQLALFLLASFGIAGFGHLLNDLFDLEQDRASGARNLMLPHSPVGRGMRLAGALLLGFLPWRWLDVPPGVWPLLGLEILLFCAYSVPPMRWKERGLLGPLADALYGYTIPLLVTWLMFSRVAGQTPQGDFGLCLAAWSLLLGLRQILSHQLEDAGRDERARLSTFVTAFGWGRTLRWLDTVMLPLEGGAFLLFLAFLSRTHPWIPFTYLAYLAWIGLRQQRHGLRPAWSLPRVERLFFCNVTAFTRYQARWLPLLLLLGALPRCWDLALAHFLLFENGPKLMLRDHWPR